MADHLALLLRSTFVEHLRSAHGNSRDMYIVTAMDAETFKVKPVPAERSRN